MSVQKAAAKLKGVPRIAGSPVLEDPENRHEAGGADAALVGVTRAMAAGCMLVLLAITACPLQARADEESGHLDCSRRDITQADLSWCAAQDARGADADLNALYGRLRQRFGPEDRTRLQETQRAWIAFRDRECTFRTGGGMHQEGSIWPMEVHRCEADMSRQRTRELAEQERCPSWDLSCPAR